MFLFAAVAAALKIKADQNEEENSKKGKKKKITQRRPRRWWVRPWLLRRHKRQHNTLYGLRLELQVCMTNNENNENNNDNEKNAMMNLSIIEQVN